MANVGISRAPFPIYAANVPLPGALTPATFKTLPGGTNQSGTKIWRRVTYSYNNQATATNGLYVFSQKQALQGQQGNVVSNHHDLGDDFLEGNDMFIWQEFGLRFTSAAVGAQAYVGIRIQGDVVPQDTPQGTFVTYNINPFQYGSVKPVIPNGNEYFALPDARKLADVLSYKNAVAPFISTSGTTSLAANTVSMVKGGVLIENK